MSKFIALYLCLLHFFASSNVNCIETTDKSTENLILTMFNDHFQDGVTIMTFYSCQMSKQEKHSMVINLSKKGISSLILDHFNGYFVDYKVVERTIIVLDVSCGFSEDLIKKANDYQMFSVSYKWLIVSNENVTILKEKEMFDNVDCFVDSDITIATKVLNKNVFKLTNIYKRRPTSNLIYEDIGNVVGNLYKSNENYEEITAERRRNLGNITLNNCIVITNNITHKHLLDKREKHVDTITKVNYVFMLHLADLLNVTMNFSFVETWGYYGNDSQWTGMIGKLTRKSADIGGTALFFTTDRVPIIDYIAMTTPTKSKFVFRQPKLSYITNVYSLPFHASVWWACIGCVVITAVTLFIGMKWEWYKKKHYMAYKNVSNTDELHDNPVDVAFMAFAAVCQQGANAIPFSLIGRVVTILLYTSLMFLYTSYSANIVALLQSSSTSIQTLEDLLRSRLLVGVDDTVFNHFYFPNASEPIRKALYQQKVAPPGSKPRYFPIEEGVRRLREGLFAFHMETGAGYKIVGETFREDEKCGLQEIQFLQVPDPWLAIQKNSSFKEMIKIGLRKLHESGIQNREVSLLYTKKPVCTSRGSSFVGVAMVDCYPAALVFAVGIAIAGGIFILEIFVHQLGKQGYNRCRI